MFARGAPFLVALSGEVEVLDDGATLRMTRGKPLLCPFLIKPRLRVQIGSRVRCADLRREIRRGEGVRVGEEWARVSTMEDRKVQRARAEPPPSVSTGAGREGCVRIRATCCVTSSWMVLHVHSLKLKLCALPAAGRRRTCARSSTKPPRACFGSSTGEGSTLATHEVE